MGSAIVLRKGVGLGRGYGQIRIEKMVGRDAVILTSATPDGFEVSFEYNRRQMAELSEAFACADLSLNSQADFARRLD
jgi:hypothetical protein